ncbi:WD-repeat protein [Reticulomyxa filosa]|uniref:WD-repeat protein n=1 Tax=Reticulomyxa filosa TaxID=46433 RepID=X6NWQ3_RETFI|nr:WD-repeat protein [Reticulomyxa filosa]|eukprot:ETO30386.1 WD-repeat protein [Reticulomyxa filosa]
MLKSELFDEQRQQQTPPYGEEQLSQQNGSRTSTGDNCFHGRLGAEASTPEGNSNQKPNKQGNIGMTHMSNNDLLEHVLEVHPSCCHFKPLILGIQWILYNFKFYYLFKNLFCLTCLSSQNSRKREESELCPFQMAPLKNNTQSYVNNIAHISYISPKKCDSGYEARQCPPKKLDFGSSPLRNKNDTTIKGIGECSPAREYCSDNMQVLVKYLKQQSLKQVPECPYLMLSAPDMCDDVYASLLDWSRESNCLATGLQSDVWLYTMKDGTPRNLTQIAGKHSINPFAFANAQKWRQHQQENTLPIITSVKFSPRVIFSHMCSSHYPFLCVVKKKWFVDCKGQKVAVGTNSGKVSLWDVNKECLDLYMHGPGEHIGVLEWTDQWDGSCMVVGSKQSNQIYFYDLRARHNKRIRTVMMNSTPASLKWSPSHNCFAVGGCDHCVNVWDNRNLLEPYYTCRHHNAPVRALAWSPHDHHILASGGGTNDSKICLWNTTKSASHSKTFWNCCNGTICCVLLDLTVENKLGGESQVTNLLWDPSSCRLLSTHGHFTNDISLWDGKTLRKVEANVKLNTNHIKFVQCYVIFMIYLPEQRYRQICKILQLHQLTKQFNFGMCLKTMATLNVIIIGMELLILSFVSYFHFLLFIYFGIFYVFCNQNHIFYFVVPLVSGYLNRFLCIFSFFF